MNSWALANYIIARIVTSSGQYLMRISGQTLALHAQATKLEFARLSLGQVGVLLQVILGNAVVVLLPLIMERCTPRRICNTLASAMLLFRI